MHGSGFFSHGEFFPCFWNNAIWGLVCVLKVPSTAHEGHRNNLRNALGLEVTKYVNELQH